MNSDDPSEDPLVLQTKIAQAGQLPYRSTKAGECLTALRNVSCEEFAYITPEQAPSVCLDMFPPNKKDKEECSIDKQCISKRCMLRGPDRDQCPGQCEPQLKDGAACDYDNDCLSGHCGEDDGTCKKTGGNRKIGESCKNSEECVVSTVCNADKSVCDYPKKPNEGDTCVETDDCTGPQTTLVCHPTQKKCIKFKIIETKGDICDPDLDMGLICNEFKGLDCRKQVEPGDPPKESYRCDTALQKGDKCLDAKSSEAALPCDFTKGLYCPLEAPEDPDKPVDAFCQEKLPTGKSCADGEGCLSNYCHPSKSVCADFQVTDICE